MVRILLLAAAIFSFLLAGCGGGESHPVRLASISVFPSTVSIAPGTTTRLRATGTYSDGTMIDITASVFWSSSAPGVASVENASGSEGVVTAVAAGTAVVSATLGGVSGSATVTVSPLLSINVTPGNAQGIVGGTQQFAATGVLSNGATQDLTPFVTFGTSDSTLATVTASGLATAVGAGSPNVTASFGGIGGSAPFNVLTVTSIAITPASVGVPLGGSAQLTATATLSDGSHRDLSSRVTWSSTNASVASVSSTGLVSALAPGSATVTASLGAVSNSVPVTVQAPTSITVTPGTPNALAGSTLQFAATGNFPNGVTQDITRFVTFSAGTPSVASFSTAGTPGLASVSGAGTTTVTASVGGVSGSTTLSVGTLSTLAISPANPTLGLNSAQQLSALGTLSNGTVQDLTGSVDWSSGNSAVASVGNTAGTKGLVTANAVGSATITARFGSVFSGTPATTTVTVTQSAPNVANRAFVTNFGSNTVSVIDTGNNTVVATVPVGSGPRGIALNGNSSVTSVYVANSGAGTVSIFPIASTGGAATAVAVGAGPWGIAADTFSNRVYVTNSQGNSVTVLSGSGAFVATIGVGASPKGIALNGGANRAYVANSGDNTVSVIDTATNTVIKTVAVGGGPVDLAVDPLEGVVFVVNSFSSTVSVIATANNAVVDTVPVGSTPQGVAINPLSSRAMVTSSGVGSVTVLSTADDSEIATVSVGGAPLGVGFKGSVSRAYVAKNGTNTVDVIDTVGNVVLGTVSVGSSPMRIAVVP